MTIKTGIAGPDGREEELSEYLSDWPGCPNVAEHVLGCVKELGLSVVVCQQAHGDKSQFKSLIDTVRSRSVAGLRTVSLLKASRSLLPGHRQVQPFLRRDEVIVDVLAQVDLHPIDFPIKYAGKAGVV